MTCHSENLDKTIERYRRDLTINDEDFRLLILGAAVIDNIFGGNQDHSVRADRAFIELDAVLSELPSKVLHSWTELDDGVLACTVCKTLVTDCGATTESWLCSGE